MAFPIERRRGLKGINNLLRQCQRGGFRLFEGAEGAVSTPFLTSPCSGTKLKNDIVAAPRSIRLPLPTPQLNPALCVVHHWPTLQIFDSRQADSMPVAAREA